MLCADGLKPELHSHRAAQIMISLDHPMEVLTEKEKRQCRGITIPSGMAHTAQTNGGRVLIFLFDSTTNAAANIRAAAVLPDEDAAKIQKAYECFEEGERSASDCGRLMQCVFRCCEIDAAETTIMDARIECALTYIRSHLHEKITCADAAGQVFLSPGRFSHLFKEKMGISFAGYLVYQRMMKAYAEIIGGKGITEAAIDAGFSSSAHFAEISKRIFGLSASAVTKDLRFFKIAEI